MQRHCANQTKRTHATPTSTLQAMQSQHGNSVLTPTLQNARMHVAKRMQYESEPSVCGRECIGNVTPQLMSVCGV